MFYALSNADRLPRLPEPINKAALIDWGESLVDRSEAYANRNRLGAVYLRPTLTFLTGVTGAAGVAATFNGWYGLVVVALSAAATALNALLSWSQPERLYIYDRIEQSLAWKELNEFKAGIGIYSESAESEACRIFVQRMTEVTHAQIQQWAASRLGAVSEAPKEVAPEVRPNTN